MTPCPNMTPLGTDPDPTLPTLHAMILSATPLSLQAARVPHVNVDMSLASRRLMLQTVCATAAMAAFPAVSTAAYGEAAGQKLPALVPSPIRPTGEMAKTCEIVALGREDVCLEFKKLLTAYEELQMTRLLESLEGSDSEVKGLAQSVLKSDWNALKEQLESPAVAALDKANNKKLAAACKKEDSGAAVKAVLAMSR
jgi:hypothetical protein